MEGARRGRGSKLVLCLLGAALPLDQVQGEAAQLLLEIDGLGAALGVGLAAGFVKLHALKAKVVNGAVPLLVRMAMWPWAAAAGAFVALHRGVPAKSEEF